MVTAFLTDSTVCIGCKACEVACKEWNEVPDDGMVWSGLSYDNTLGVGHSTWRHVKFVERTPVIGVGGNAGPHVSWEFSSDVCKHCEVAGCLEHCPTGSIVRTETGAVFVQPDICNGCGYCVVGCPFGVIDRRPDDGRAFKCTFCYDRQRAGLQPACAKVCPTDSIRFGEIGDLRREADRRIAALKEKGIGDAVLWDPRDSSVGGVHALFIVRGDPRAYNLPLAPELPTVLNRPAWTSAALGAALMLAGTFLAFAAGAGTTDSRRVEDQRGADCDGPPQAAPQARQGRRPSRGDARGRRRGWGPGAEGKAGPYARSGNADGSLRTPDRPEGS